MYWNIIIFLVGLGIGILVSKILRSAQNDTINKGDVITEKVEKKEENLQKIQEFIAGKEKVTNDEIESLLQVSNATATRYLDELENQGILRQVGETGKYTYYEKV